MGNETAETKTPHAETCVCREVAHHLTAMFGIRSEGAREHLRNARIEVLKAMRTVIDDRIEYLSRAGAKGTKLSVE